LTAVLDVNLPGMDKAAAKALVDEAEKVCPYSNATRGNVETKYNLV
jgi:organic hydroperoxide reductase OsmC/OhrA